MECNREEALRAKELAEKKMESKDFSAALKIAVKAQQLYPQLENVSQMIVVCEVHISGEKKTYGAEKDWYAILKVEPSADDASIKKQYRKLALILHPDKNKFSGSTDAFKLIGEAQRILLDRDKRLLHDSKRRSFGKVSAQSWNPRQPSRPTNVQPHPWNQTHPVNFNNYTGVRPGNFQFPHQQQQQTPTGIRLTFWTVCPFCSVRYQFYRDDVLNKVINCQSCKKSFTAFELNQSSTAATQTRQPPGPNKIPVNLTQPVFTKKTGYEKPVNLKQNTKPQGAVNNRKRKKVVEESSESSDSSSESEEEEDANIGNDDNGVPKNVDTNQYFGEEPRRSSRTRRNVSYKENLNDIDQDDDDDDDEDDAEKGVEDKFWKAEVKKKAEEDQKKDVENNNGVKNDNKGRHEPNSADKMEEDSSEEDSEPVLFECPEPDFTDFEKNRKEESFKAGQLWACYDTEDAMPRFYAFVKKVLSPGFKLQIFWLKPDPVNEEEFKWVDDDLPVSCGRFTRGKHDKAEDLYAFSHLVSWESARSQKGGQAYNIFPRKGETWALFKNWNINWRADEKRKYEYEFVEILSDYDENYGVRVSYLEKVKGFVSIFRPKKEDNEAVIGNGSDKYRFAHMVPSVRMSGEERKGVPTGSYELDPAALPPSIFDLLDNNEYDAEKGKKDEFWKAEVKKEVEEDQKKDSENNDGIKNDNNKFPHDDNKECHEPNSADKEEDGREDDSEPVHFECPEADFSDFEKNRKEEFFKAGQVWACYDTDDSMPRFYAFVKKVLSPGFKLQIFWLKPDPVNEEEFKWVDDDLPVSCGRFTCGKHDKAEDLYAFSHLVLWEIPRSLKGGLAYNIFPRKGETWAVFKNWNINWRADEKRKYEYDFVEILSDYDENNGVRVSYLEKVKGFVSIFRPKKEDKETVIGNGSDKYKFSHMVPSVRMSGEERKGVPIGSYELDPAALPQSMFEQLDLLDDNDDEDDAEKEKKDKFWRAEVKNDINMKFQHDNKKHHDSNSVEESEPELFECPGPDFSDFENNRKEYSFRAGQLWACYDTEDAMPRFYAFVKKVLSPGFKLQIFWLKPDPVNEEEFKWVDDDLPVSCGRFTRGNHNKAEDRYAFSHLVSWESARSQKGGAGYNILPRKGETWAVFKNWNINWRTDEKRKYEYEFVEILSDYDENNGVRVLYLEKVKGFVSIFRPKKEDNEAVIGNGSDKYRFAHMVPSVRMSGEERKGVPIGSYELDPAALPQSIFEQLDL